MAFITGTAPNHIALFNIIRDFLVSNADLVSASQEWTQLLGSGGTLVYGDKIFLKGPGLSGTDSIYCGIQAYENSSSDIYNLLAWGNAGYEPSETDPNSQPLRSGVKNLGLWGQPIDYWLSGNGRHWKIACMVSSVQTMMYCGLGLPLGSTPSQYPYPFIIHGSMRGTLRYSDNDERNSFLAHPGYGTTDLYYPDNSWRAISNTVTSNNTSLNWAGQSLPGYMHPRLGDDSTPLLDSPNQDEISALLAPCVNGERYLQPCTIYSGSTQGPYKSPMCHPEGIFRISGRDGVSAGDVIDINGVDYVVVQNHNRNGFKDYLAMELG